MEHLFGRPRLLHLALVHSPRQCLQQTGLPLGHGLQKTVVERLARTMSRTSRRTWSRSLGSRLAKGSSRSSSSGCGASARPRATRCC